MILLCFQSLKQCNIKLVSEVNDLIEYNKKQKENMEKTNVSTGVLFSV